jgi:flagellar hook-associated protein 3 FlgL
MIQRVTQATLIRELQASIARVQRQLLVAQDTVSSQKRLHEASDDPAAVARVNRLRGETRALTALSGNVAFGTTVLGAEDASLDLAEAVMTRAREIATQQASGLMSPEARQQAAEEVKELERSLLALGNTAVGGRYVFGGLVSGAAPFANFDDPGFDPTTAYTGPSDPFVIRSGTDQSLRLTTAGNQVFGQSLLALDNLRQTLEAGNAPVTSLDEIENGAATLRAERASVGARLARVQRLGQEISNALDNVRKELGRLEDADLALAISDLVQLQTALQATLAVGSALQTSILDYVNP